MMVCAVLSRRQLLLVDEGDDVRLSRLTKHSCFSRFKDMAKLRWIGLLCGGKEVVRLRIKLSRGVRGMEKGREMMGQRRGNNSTRLF